MRLFRVKGTTNRLRFVEVGEVYPVQTDNELKPDEETFKRIRETYASEPTELFKHEQWVEIYPEIAQ